MELVIKLNVVSIPTILFMKDSKIVESYVGTNFTYIEESIVQLKEDSTVWFENQEKFFDVHQSFYLILISIQNQ